MSEEPNNLTAPSIYPINIEDEMRSAYIDYSMSVIVSRALPDVRDGLKPVHRRVLYGMRELGLTHNKAHKKSARIVGEVLGKYHPHGDASIYDAMVRLAQPWSLRCILVDGHGNFGSIDGDEPAAMRYTEARLHRLAEELLIDIDKKTVDFQLNFDDSLSEPIVLPARVPNLLVNGTSGIAVGMASNMPPHNLIEVVNGTLAYIEDKDITIQKLIKHIPAPDFPTGGIIYGYQGVQEAFLTGRGRVVIRAKTDFHTTSSGKEQIVVTEIPYMVNKAMMIEKTAALVNDKKITGISNIRDESDREGYRIVYDLKKDAIPNVVLNNLFKYTSLQVSYGVNNVALVKGRPQTLNLKELIGHFVDHRHEVIVRRTQFELDQAQKREHILQGYLIALDHLDEVIALIRNAKDVDIANQQLMERFQLSKIQSKAILEMRLQRLTGLEREKIQKEHQEIKILIEKLNQILAQEPLRMDLIKEELLEIKERYGDDRRTQIVYSDEDLTIEDMIPNEEMVITFSHQGYVKRTPLTEYRIQGRGGVGSKAALSKIDDYIEHLFVASSHNYLLIFTEQGRLFWKRAHEIPEGNKLSKGRSIQNLLNIHSEDRIKAVLNIKNLTDAEYCSTHFIVLCTQKGIIKKTRLQDFSRPRANGIAAIKIREGDGLLMVTLTDGNNHIIMASSEGKAIHFHESKIRPMSRIASGVKGITLESAEDKVIGVACVDSSEATLLVISQKGYGKRSSIEDYRITNRGGKGVKTLNITNKTGKLVAIKQVNDNDELMIINKSGISIRVQVDGLRVMGRNAQGVRVIRLNPDDAISSVEKIQNIDS